MINAAQLEHIEQVLREAVVLPDGWRVVGCTEGTRGVVGGSIRLAIAYGRHMRGTVESAEVAAILAEADKISGCL